MFQFGVPAAERWSAVAVSPKVVSDAKQMRIWANATDHLQNPLPPPLADSSGNDGTEFVVGDLIGAPYAYYYPQVYGDLPSTMYVINWAQSWDALEPGTQLNMAVGGLTGGCGLIRIWELDLEAGRTYRFAFSSSGAADVRTALFRSAGAGTWQDRGQAVFEITPDQAPHDYIAPDTGTYGLVVFNNAKEDASGTFWLRVDPVQSEPQPDLVVESVQPATTVAGQSTTIAVTVKNQGAATAAASHTRVSLDGATVCSSIATGLIDAGQTQTMTCSLPAQTEGSYSIEACADVNDDVGELNEGNNCGTSVLTVTPVGTTQYPNLQVTFISPVTAVEGQGINLLGHILNVGTANAPASYTRVRVDGGVRCAAVATDPVGYHDKATAFCPIGPLAEGSHSVEFCADTTLSVVESNETDNCRTETLTITPAPRPDLVIESINPDDISEGQPVTVSIVVRNRGTADAPATLTRLSLLKTGTGPWEIATPAITAGSARTVMQLIGYLPVRSVLATACADYADEADEVFETNNCLSDSIRVRPLNITVYPDGSGSHPTIQEAMDAVAAGGYVLLADGTFTGPGNRDLDFRGRAMKVGNLAGARPVIDCEYAPGNEHRGFYFHTAEGRDSEVFGISVTNGHPTHLYPGGAVRIIGASPTFRDCIFTNCQAMLVGGAVSLEGGGAPLFSGCRFSDNVGIGGGLYSDNSTPTIEDSVFTGNFNSAIVSAGTSFVTVTGCTIDANTLGIACMNTGKVNISHTIVSYSTEPTAEAIYCANVSGCATITCSNVYGNAGGDWVGSIAGMESVDGNFSADPQYCDPGEGDLQLMADSPCAEENHAACGRVGAQGIGCPASMPRTFVVHPDGSGDWPTIQDALLAAWDGDIIELTDGTFIKGGNLNLSLSGSAGRGAVTIRSQSGDPSACVLDLEGGGVMRYAFRFSDFGSNAQATLEGFTIRNGHYPSGGAIFCDDSSPALRNMAFENCSAVGAAPNGMGGALYGINGSNPIMATCEFIGNSAENSGGAIYLSGGGLSLADCLFTVNNAALYGGAIFQRSGTQVTIDDSRFEDNTAQDGAGIYSRGTGSRTNLNRCTLKNNTASGSGGAIYGREGIIFDLDGCTLNDNGATYGGGMYTVFNCEATLDGCTAYGNSASNIAGGLRIYTDSSAVLNNTILWANTAPDGPQVGMWSNSTLTVGCSDIQGGEMAIFKDAGSLVFWGTGNIDQDPVFCDAPNGDFHLHATSPCAIINNPICSQIGAWPMGCGPHDVIVSADGSGGYPDLAEAVAAAWDETTILMLDGTYTGSGNRNVDPAGKAIVIRSQSGNPDACVIDLQNAGRAFYLHSGEGPDTVISGITIRNGYSSDGAGIFCNGASPTISNCRFIDNSATNAGGGVRVNTAAAVVEDCDFVGNHAVWGGGGLYNFHASPTVSGCTFTDNTSDHWGGGIHNQYAESVPLIKGCAFMDNAAEFGGGIFNRGGASPIVVECTFDRNQAVAYSGGGMYTKDSGSPQVINCHFRGNAAADDGGGMYNNDYCSSTITNTIFSGNTAADKAGGLYLRDHDTSTVTNCTFSMNHSAYGGGIYVWNYGTPAIANSIFWDNTAGNGSQIGIESYGTTDIHHCDLQGGQSNIYLATSASVNWGFGNMTDENPLFVDADGSDDLAGSPDDNLHLQSLSPCIDQGGNTLLPVDATDLDEDGNTTEPIPFDMDQDTRIVDGNLDAMAVVDMGADEYAQSVACESDRDNDGDVDGSDLALLAADSSVMDVRRFAFDFGKKICE